MNRRLWWLALWMCVYTPLLYATTSTLAEKENLVIDELIGTQDRFYRLALAFDLATVQGTQSYPRADWSLAPSARDTKYQELFLVSSQQDKALIQRISQTRYSYHYDVLRVFAEADEQGISTQTLLELRQGRLQTDPFSMGLYLGYASTNTDFALISVGYDLRPDVLGFSQSVSGAYQVQDQPTTASMGEIRRLGSKVAPESDSWYSGVQVDSRNVYDPTNGLLSRGDVVFRRRNGDDYMFSYEADRLLNKNNFVKKDLRQTLLPYKSRTLFDGVEPAK